jgi:HlyD family secretion protein
LGVVMLQVIDLQRPALKSRPGTWVAICAASWPRAAAPGHIILSDAPTAQDQPLTANPTRRWSWRIGFIVLALGLVLVVASFGARWRALLSVNTSISLARLSIAVVERGALVRDVAGEAKVVAAASPTLFATQGGTVTLKTLAGGQVRRGQLLAEIDSPELRARLAQEQSNADALQADVLRAEVEVRQQAAALQAVFENAGIDFTSAQNDLSRQQQAFDAGATARIQVDRARDTLEKARLALAQAEAGRGLKRDSLQFDVQAKRAALARQQFNVKDLQRQVSELLIRSPVDGQVGQLFVAERASVARDAKLLSVIDLSALEVQMQVSESSARDLAIGMPGDISGNGQQWPGLVSAISPEVVNNEVAARLRFVGQTPAQLRQNQRLSVRVLIDKRDHVLTLRRGSFVDESAGAFAYVLRGERVAEKVAIRLGARSIDKVEVLSGLQAGDRVVIAGADSFKGEPRAAISD